MDEWISADPRQVLPGLNLLANDGDPQAQLLLGQLLINGAGISRNPDRAFHWFKTAAEARLPMAINMARGCHEYGLGTPVDRPTAFEWRSCASSRGSKTSPLPARAPEWQKTITMASGCAL